MEGAGRPYSAKQGRQKMLKAKIFRRVMEPHINKLAGNASGAELFTLIMIATKCTQKSRHETAKAAIDSGIPGVEAFMLTHV